MWQRIVHNTNGQSLKGFSILENVISKSDEVKLLQDIDFMFKRRRYATGHWDDVITDYREREVLRTAWPMNSKCILNTAIENLPKLNLLPAVHVIDLAPEGHIKPHIDSIKFSGGTIASLSLNADSLLILRKDEECLKVHLPRRSLYMLQGAFRYEYTHEIIQNGLKVNENCTIENKRRVSIMFRDEK